MNFMKKLWAVLLLLVASGQVFADEGMWVLKELNKQNLARMKELGFTPSYEQLYSETDPCVANAVVIFGGGCSGITVSNEGLIHQPPLGFRFDPAVKQCGTRLPERRFRFPE